MTYPDLDPDSLRLARELADITGESLSEAIRLALRERLARHDAGAPESGLATRIRTIQELVAQLPVLDARTADDLVGYDGGGLPA